MLLQSQIISILMEIVALAWIYPEGKGEGDSNRERDQILFAHQQCKSQAATKPCDTHAHSNRKIKQKTCIFGLKTGRTNKNECMTMYERT